MLLNLSRSFHFDRDKKEYQVEYQFTKELMQGAAPNDICLVLHVSVNDQKIKSTRINKASATLYQSNEVIENMIREETITFLEQ